MKNAGIIGNILIGMIMMAQPFETNKVTGNSIIFLFFFLAIAYNALAYEIKFMKDNSWSNAHMVIALIYLINTFWCPVIEINLALSLAIVAYHLFLTKKPNSLNMIGFLIGTLVYLYEGYEIIKESDKSFISWIKLIACVILIIYYVSHIKEGYNKEKNY